MRIIAIDGNLYDVTDFVDSHPGGDCIYQALSKSRDEIVDASTIFKTVHYNYRNPEVWLLSHPKIRKMGVYPHSPFNFGRWERIRNFLPGYALDNYLIPEVLIYSLTFYLTIVTWERALASSTVMGAIVYSILCGMCSIVFGFQMYHPTIHSPPKNEVMRLITSFLIEFTGGMSEVGCRKLHDIDHHSLTNTEKDSDMYEMYPILRLLPSQKILPFHRFQKYYAYPIYSIISFLAEIRLSIGIFYIPSSERQKVIFVIGKALNFYYWYYLSSYSKFFWIAMILRFIVSSVIFSSVILLNHQGNILKGNKSDDYATRQIYATTDVRYNNILVDFILNILTGGLFLHTAHHLFPRVSWLTYPRLTREIISGLEGYSQQTFFEGIRKHHSLLERMGRE